MTQVRGESLPAGDDGPENRTTAQIIEQAAELAESAPTRALDLVTDLLTPTLRRADPAVSARAGQVRAQALAELGKHEQALSAARATRRDCLAAGLLQEAHLPELVRAQVLHELGDHKAAVAVAAAIHDQVSPDAGVSAASPDADTRARAHLIRANALSHLGDHFNALHHFDLAWDQFAALGAEALQARTEGDRGKAYLRFDMVRRALADLRRAHDTFVSLALSHQAARYAVPLAEALHQTGSVREALRVLIGAEEHFLAHGPTRDLARAKMVKVHVLLHGGLFHDAHTEASEAVDLLSGTDLIEDLGTALLTVGTCSVEVGDLASSHRDLAMADRMLTAGQNPHLRSLVRQGRAWLALHEGDREAVHEYASQARALVPDGVHLPSADLMMASASKDPERGQEHLDRAAHTLAPDPDNPMWLAHGTVTAQIQRRNGDLEGARDTLLAALERRASTSPGQLRGMPLTGPGIDILINVLLALGDPGSIAQAWQWANVARAVRLDELNGGGTTAEGTEGSDEAATNRGQVLEELSSVLDKLNDPARRPDDQRVERAQRAARRTLRQRLLRDHRMDRGSVPLPPIPEGPVLQFHVIGEDVVSFVIREGQVYAHLVRGGARLVTTQTSRWAVECSRMTHVGRHQDAGSTEGRTGTEALRSLAALLLEPVTELLEDLRDDPGAEPLVLVTHLHLDRVPFEALPLGDGVPFGRGHRLAFVGDPFTDGSQVPFATLGPVGDSALVLAVPDERAPRIAREAAVVSAIRPAATVAVGEEATTRRLALEASRHDLVHIAAHGMWDPRHPLRSALRLSDRWITSTEILELDLTGAVVVLNACFSGQGWETTTEVGGLLWAMLATGCRGVVTTLWAVDDDTALEFARLLHTRLAAGDDPADAVPAATAELAERWPHPWHWAAFRYTATH